MTTAERRLPSAVVWCLHWPAGSRAHHVVVSTLLCLHLASVSAAPPTASHGATRPAHTDPLLLGQGGDTGGSTPPMWPPRTTTPGHRNPQQRQPHNNSSANPTPRPSARALTPGVHSGTLILGCNPAPKATTPLPPSHQPANPAAIATPFPRTPAPDPRQPTQPNSFHTTSPANLINGPTSPTSPTSHPNRPNQPEQPTNRKPRRTTPASSWWTCCQPTARPGPPWRSRPTPSPRRAAACSPASDPSWTSQTAATCTARGPGTWPSWRTWTRCACTRRCAPRCSARTWVWGARVGMGRVGAWVRCVRAWGRAWVCGRGCAGVGA